MRLDPDIKRDVEDELRSDPDNIEVRPQVPSIEIKRKIEEALRRAAEIDASRITVEANGSEITLRGMECSGRQQNRQPHKDRRVGTLDGVVIP